jgi:ATP-binding cassette, subfamily C (CFTR/MRP), member 1
MRKVHALITLQVSMGQYQHSTYRAITMVRGGLISMIFRKTGDLSLNDVDPASSMTLMSADIERIVQGWQTMPEIWANAIEIGLAIYLLEQQLGVACVVPVVVALSELWPSALRYLLLTLIFPSHSILDWLDHRFEFHHVEPGCLA